MLCVAISFIDLMRLGTDAYTTNIICTLYVDTDMHELHTCKFTLRHQPVQATTSYSLPTRVKSRCYILVANRMFTRTYTPQDAFLSTNLSTAIA